MVLIKQKACNECTILTPRFCHLHIKTKNVADFFSVNRQSTYTVKFFGKKVNPIIFSDLLFRNISELNLLTHD